jgi:hypothetical protein
VLDANRLQGRLQAAAARFADDVVRLYAQALENHVDLGEDPRRWNARRRPANTNGSILLEQYVGIATPEALRRLGPAFVIAVLTIGVVSEPRALFRERPIQTVRGPCR